jgi:hypothetical protein
MQFSKKPILNNNLNGEKSPNLADLHFCCPNMAVPGKMFFFFNKAKLLCHGFATHFRRNLTINRGLAFTYASKVLHQPNNGSTRR